MLPYFDLNIRFYVGIGRWKLRKFDLKRYIESCKLCRGIVRNLKLNERGQEQSCAKVDIFDRLQAFFMTEF